MLYLVVCLFGMGIVVSGGLLGCWFDGGCWWDLVGSFG